MHALVEARDRRMRFLSTTDDVVDALARLRAATTRSMWNMQRHAALDDLVNHDAIDRPCLDRGVTMRHLLPRRVAEERCPLLSSIKDYLRLAPVAHPLMVIDGRLVVVGDIFGETVWTTTDPVLVADAVAFYEAAWSSAEPAVPQGEEPPFTPRMVAIGIRLAEGATDRQIARAIGVSERTVSADVHEMSRRLGARSRIDAVARICGRT